MHTLVYTPLAEKDLRAINSYIAFDLKAPQTARKLLGRFETSIKHLRRFPFAYPLYRSSYPLEDEFRLMPVDNYLVFYVVLDATVEIRRIIYAGRDRGAGPSR